MGKRDQIKAGGGKAHAVTRKPPVAHAIGHEQDIFSAFNLKHFPLGYHSLDQDGIILDVNPRWLSILGYSRQEVVGQWFGNFVPPDFRQQWQENFAYYKKSGTAHRREVPMLRKDGSVLTALISGSIRYDKQGNPLSSHTIIVDIKPESIAHQRFMHIGSLLQQLFDNVSSAIAIYDVVNDGEDFLFVDVNRSLEKIEKVSKKDIIGKSVLQVFPGVKQFGLFGVFKKVWKTGKPQHHPISIYKDERIAGWRDNYIYKLPTGEIAAVYDDVTERKTQEELLRESENKYRNLYETMAQGVIYQDADGEVISMNPAARRILGVDLQGIRHLEQIDNNIRAIREDGTSFPAAEHPSMVTLKTSQPVHDAIMGIYNPVERGYRWLIVNSVPLFSPGQNKPYQVFVTFDDITHIRRYEETLRERESEFRTLSENSAGIVARFDSDLRYAYINPAIERFTGTKPEGFIGKNHRELDIPDEDKLLWTNKLWQVFSTGKPLSFELTMRTGDNEYYLFNTIAPEFAAGGSVKSVLSIGS
ncbi:MAG TPA: PAS domain S-box protein, partial [Dehalococcoidia bacterium]|nr:PAS domain S-box protein [Dehalococcoidia bacterium]